LLSRFSKYCRYKNVSASIDVFIRCSGFRGIEAHGSVVHEQTAHGNGVSAAQMN